jgi:hypothetical protein
MSVENIPQSQPLRGDQVPNNAGMKSLSFFFEFVFLKLFSF